MTQYLGNNMRDLIERLHSGATTSRDIGTHHNKVATGYLSEITWGELRCLGSLMEQKND